MESVGKEIPLEERLQKLSNTLGVDTNALLNKLESIDAQQLKSVLDIEKLDNVENREVDTLPIGDAFFAAYQGNESVSKVSNKDDGRETNVKPSGGLYSESNRLALNAACDGSEYPMPSDPRFVNAIQTIKDKFPEVINQKKGIYGLKNRDVAQVLVLSSFNLDNKFYLIGAGLGQVESSGSRFGSSPLAILIEFNDTDSCTKAMNSIEEKMSNTGKIEQVEILMQTAFGEKMDKFGSKYSTSRFRFPFDSNKSIRLISR